MSDVDMDVAIGEAKIFGDGKLSTPRFSGEVAKAAASRYSVPKKNKSKGRTVRKSQACGISISGWV